MPIYEYVCAACGNRFEKLQKTADANDPLCPVCGSKEVRKELSTFSSGGGASSGSCAPATGGG